MLKFPDQKPTEGVCGYVWSGELRGAVMRDQPGRRRWLIALSVSLGLVLGTGLVWPSSQAALTAQTSNRGNGFNVGSVTLTDDDSGTAMFAVTGLQPGATGQKCVAVTYAGSIDASIKAFVAPGDLTGTGLGPYLNLTIEEGTGGSFGSCTGFTPATSDFSGTLAGFAGGSTSSANGVGTFTPTGGSGATTVYRFAYTVADTNAAQGRTATVRFSWEATNT
jgi:hypothetical protein